jgi:excisionase family DNA binding protein
MSLDDLPATVSVEHAGRILGISRGSAYRAAARGELPTLRLGRRLLVPTARLLALLGADGRASDSSQELSHPRAAAEDCSSVGRTERPT